MTNRDIEILGFISRFGKCKVDHIAAYFGLSKIRAYQILGRLRGEGLVCFYRVFHNEPGIFTCTSEGAKNTSHEKIRDFNIASLKHDLKIIDIFLDKYKAYDFKTEREIRKNKSLDHFPDMIFRKEDHWISLEVELTRKSKSRMESIRNFYLKNTKISEVHYYVPGELKEYLENIFFQLNMFKVYEL